jgi:hypothetical protein
MTDTGSRPSRAGSAGGTYSTAPARTGWTGWVFFASAMMFLLGIFQIVEGLVAVFDDGYYHVTESGLVVNVDYTAWGWVHLLVGVLLVVSGAGVLSGNVLARAVGVVLAVLSAVLNLLFIAAYPIWSTIIITVDVLVIYALTVHGGELADSTR